MKSTKSATATRSNTTQKKPQLDDPLEFKKCIQCRKNVPRQYFAWEYTCTKCVTASLTPGLLERQNGYLHPEPRIISPTPAHERNLQLASNKINNNGINLDGTPITYTDEQLLQQTMSSINVFSRSELNYKKLRLALELLNE